MFPLAALALAMSLAGCTASGTDAVNTRPGAQPKDNPVRYVKVVKQVIPETLDLYQCGGAKIS